jgi:hypothetical protein
VIALLFMVGFVASVGVLIAIDEAHKERRKRWREGQWKQ